MQQILVYGDSLSWGIVPGSRGRHPFAVRWPGRLELRLQESGRDVRIIEDCLNGRRTVWDDPFKAGRNGLVGLAQRIEVNSPLALVILMLGNNDFQSMHPHKAWHAAQGVAALVEEIRRAPIEPGMPAPPILIVAPPPIGKPAGTMADKFGGGEIKCVGLGQALAQVADNLDCDFFDAGSVIKSSAVDGVHLDAGEHTRLGDALIGLVTRLLGPAD
ncbi:SGNH/GDSL hydrolase family protein [Cognatazoarcus halotolerans]|uniref:SGNH/GDSL hydrolase family protein n=1 Tax=Cognatazoarcus halotolerans TaxID=2686016 RepID=UPI001359A781|nr:SGNH/GDSL hydrolase family protein [Cognatazoarcus halotolerans]MCB1901248.1 SGNH/GDSL hydrolase family protein [Rhodocyclaceae bacterium]MCP5307935.1 SGNH/GDSL hydrolase family protein [Zoogloeaceae bacterium]